MKILHFSDIEGDQDTLDKVVRFAKKRDDLEIIVCSGDILGPMLTPEKSQESIGAWNTLAKRFSYEDLVLNPEKVVKDIRKTRDRQILAAAKSYRRLEKQIRESADTQYSELVKLFRQFPQDVLTVPGNWDVRSYHQHFAGMDIHKLSGEIKDVEFAGYGDSWIATTPPTLAVGYSEEEMYKFLTDIIPEITVTHTPPLGTLDQTTSGKRIGSRALLEYLANDAGTSNLVLCGHCHEDAGVIKVNRTMIINPGNLGRTKGKNSPTAGCFVVIDYNTQNREVDKVTGYQVADDNEIYELNGKGRIRQEVA